MCDQRINTAALREIDDYRAKQLAAHEGHDDATATRVPLLGQKSLYGINSTE